MAATLRGHLVTAVSLLRELDAAPMLEQVDVLPNGKPALHAFHDADALVCQRT